MEVAPEKLGILPVQWVNSTHKNKTKRNEATSGKKKKIKRMGQSLVHGRQLCSCRTRWPHSCARDGRNGLAARSPACCSSGSQWPRWCEGLVTRNLCQESRHKSLPVLQEFSPDLAPRDIGAMSSSMCQIQAGFRRHVRWSEK